MIEHYKLSSLLLVCTIEVRVGCVEYQKYPTLLISHRTQNSFRGWHRGSGTHRYQHHQTRGSQLPVISPHNNDDTLVLIDNIMDNDGGCRMANIFLHFVRFYVYPHHLNLSFLLVIFIFDIFPIMLEFVSQLTIYWPNKNKQWL